jgi:hypothetical protein
MKLNEEQLKQITDSNGVYNCCLLQQHFAYKFLLNEVSPHGDIFCFESPVVLGPLNMTKGLVLAGELPNTNMFGGVCFQRLYASQLGTLYSLMIGMDCYIEDSCIFTGEGTQASISILNQVKDSVIFNTIFPIEIVNKEVVFSKFQLEDTKKAEFVTNAIESFKYLTKSIFVETRRDSF